MPEALRTERLHDLADLLDAEVAALLADVDRHAEPRVTCELDVLADLPVVVAGATGTRSRDVDTDDPARAVAERLLDDHHVLVGGERPVHHQDQARAHLRVLERGEIEAVDRREDDVVEVALAASIALHRVEAQLERRDALGAVRTADRRVHTPLDRERGALDQFGQVVDPVERVEIGHAARVRHRDHAVELPEVACR